MREYITKFSDEFVKQMKAKGMTDEFELIRCKDCKHRPRRSDVGDEHEGLNLEFPDEKCPCQCEDPWYNWMPKDDWYCGNGERKEE